MLANRRLTRQSTGIARQHFTLPIFCGGNPVIGNVRRRNPKGALWPQRRTIQPTIVVIGVKMKRQIRYSSNPSLALALVISTLLLPNAVQATDDKGEIIVTLSEAKARAEGRARLLRTCSLKAKAGTISSDLLGNYIDARAAFNARIDGLAQELRDTKLKDLDVTTTLSQLNAALNKVDRFVLIADGILEKKSCLVLKKVNWATVAALVLSPEMLKLVIDYLRSSVSNDIEKETFIKKIESQKLAEWENVRLIIAYDSATSMQYSGKAITAELLSKEATIILANRWGMATKEDSMTATAARLPADISKSYGVANKSMVIDIAPSTTDAGAVRSK